MSTGHMNRIVDLEGNPLWDSEEGLLGNITTSTGTQSVSEALDDRSVLITESVTVRVPSDYPDWQAALDAYSGVSVVSGVIITILLESGYSPMQGLYISDGDYSYLRLSSEDAVVFINQDLDPVTSNTEWPGANYPRCVVIDYAVSPLFDIKISGLNWRIPPTSGNHTVERTNGIMAAGSTLSFRQSSSCGFVDFAGQNLYARGATIYARNCDFHGGGGHAVQLSAATTGEITGINATGAFWNVTSDSVNTTDAAVSVSRGCVVQAQSIDAGNSGRYGMDCRRSFVNYSGSTAVGCEKAGLSVRSGGYISAEGIDLGDGWVELNGPTGGGTINLGRESIYSGIYRLNGSDPRQPNLMYSHGIVLDDDAPMSTVGFIREDLPNVGYSVIRSDGTGEYVFEIDVDTSIDTRQEFFVPGISFQSGTPKVVTLSCGDITGEAGRDDFALMTAGMASSSGQSFSIRLTSPGTGELRRVQGKVTGRIDYPYTYAGDL